MMIMTAIDDDDIQLFVLVLEKIVFLDSFPHKICFWRPEVCAHWFHLADHMS